MRWEWGSGGECSPSYQFAPPRPPLAAGSPHPSGYSVKLCFHPTVLLAGHSAHLHLLQIFAEDLRHLGVSLPPQQLLHAVNVLNQGFGREVEGRLVLGRVLFSPRRAAVTAYSMSHAWTSHESCDTLMGGKSARAAGAASQDGWWLCPRCLRGATKQAALAGEVKGRLVPGRVLFSIAEQQSQNLKCNIEYTRSLQQGAGT